MKRSCEIKFKHKIIFSLILLIIHVRFFTDGQSISDVLRPSSTLRSGVIGSFSLPRPPHTQSPSRTIPLSTTTPPVTPSSSLFVSTSSVLATSSSYLPIPTPTQPAPRISLNISVQIPEYAFDGEEVTFLCSVQPGENVTFSWHSSDMAILSDTPNFTTILPGYFSSSSLLYCCQVSNAWYQVAESVCGMAPVVLYISSVLVHHSPQTEHTNTLLLCTALSSNASMNLAISYYWEYMGNSGDVGLIQTSSRYGLSSDNRTLTITSRSIALSGRYYCSAYFTDHILTTRNLSTIVQQYASPALHLIYVEPSAITNQLLVEIGASLTVKCSGAGYEIPNLSWRVDGVSNPPNTVIQDVSRYNPPEPNGYVTEVGTIVKSLHINRVDYPIRRLECIGTNRLSSTTVQVDVFVLASPCSPENVRMAELGENWAVVEWANGQTCLFGGQDVVVFTLRLRELSGQILSTFVSAVSSQQSAYRYNITGLAPDSFYQVDVSGENPQGSSNASSAVILHTLAPSDANVIMFPFGALPGDYLVPHGSYSQSPAISLAHPVPIGNRVSSSLYLSPLGVLSFDRPFHYWDVQQLGAGSLLQDLSILAPFWSDVDYSSQGSLFYNLYSNSNPAHAQILSNATQLVAQHAGAPSHFSAATLLVATWSRVLPHSGAQTQGLQENSFQLGLVADRSASYVLFGYKRGDVGWSATEQVSSALIGFSAASLLAEMHPLSLTAEAHRIDSSSSDDLTIIGYNISYYTDEINTAQSECESWSQSTSLLQVHAPSCPCTLLQARLDAGFYFDRITPEIPDGIECYISLFSLDGPSQRCCFTKRLQTVITGGRFRGSALASNPTTSLASYLSGERRGYMSCCILSDSCEKYYAERVSDNCSLYQPPGFVWGFGLSHLITPDENELIFNGLGEYLLIEGAPPCPVQLHVRTEQYPGTNATLLSALSLSESNCSSLLFVRLTAERSQLKIYFNDDDITESIQIQDTLSACVAISNRTDAILIRFLSGFSLAVWAQNGVLNFNLSLPRDACYLRTKGLIGEWDGEGANDLLLRNGTLLPRNVSDQGKELFYHSWRIREDESLMRYDTANFTTYNPTEYEVSLFASELFSKGIPQEIEEQCSGRRACLFDQLVSGSISLANSSRDIAIASFTSSQDINSLPPILSVPATLLVHSGSQFSYSLFPSSSSSQSLMLSSFSPLRHTLLTFSEGAYQLQGMLSEDIGEFIITLSARDITTGLVSEYSPTIFYCSCPLVDQCSFSPPLQADSGARFSNLSCGCEKGFNITQGHTCTSSPECEIQLDLHFVIDGTGSLGQSALDEELAFIATLMERFEYPPHTVGNRVGYLTFSSGVNSYHPLSTDFSSVISSLKSTLFSGGSVNLSSPLDYMLRLVYTSKVSTQTLLVYMTDEGQSTASSGNDVAVLMQLSEQLESDRGVRILVIGLGSNVDVSQLLAIATGPDDSNFLAFSSLSQAHLNVTDIIQAICQIVTLPTTSSTTQTVSTTIRSSPGGSTTSATPGGSTTPATPTTSTPPPLPSLYIVTLKFSLSHSTLLSITQNNIPEFLNGIVESLGNEVPPGTLSVVGGLIEVSFTVAMGQLERAEVRAKLEENSHLGSLYPYLTEAVITDFSSVAILGLAVYLFYYVVPALTISLTIFLLYIHFQCEALQRGKRSGGTEKRVAEEEIENSSELKDEVASVLEEEKRPRITRPGIIIPSQSLAVELGTDRTGSESISNYGMSSVSEIPLFKPRARIMSRPLSAAQISDLLSEDPPYTIHLEFDALSTNAVSAAEMPPGTESKNRYPNVLSPPHSRVPLFLKYNQPASDYINANFVRGYNMMSRAYIATQGPMYNTMDDFWRMIWEQRCEVIVMLTDLVERGRHKCIHYWPDIELSSPTISGDLEIAPLDKDYKSSYILSRFKIKLSRDSENKEVREVVHFWFKQWPDYGIPETGIPIITLLLDSRTYARNSQSPILMHCSSGIGRTGVFIALDIGMHELEKKGRADVLKIISLMRQDRGGMVQTRDQYLLVYKTLLAYSNFLKKAQQPDAD